MSEYSSVDLTVSNPFRTYHVCCPELLGEMVTQNVLEYWCLNIDNLNGLG